MKKILFTLISVCLFCSCNKNEELVKDTTKVEFNVHTPEFTITTRATVDEANIKYLYIYIDGKLVESQKSTDTDFGNPKLDLTIGIHNISFVCSAAEIIDCTQDKVGDTFGYAYNLNVTTNTKIQDITLDRLTTRLVVVFEDAIPTGVTSIKLKSKFYNKYNPVTLLAEAYITEKNIDVSKKVGTTEFTPCVNILSTTLLDSWAEDLVVEVYKSNTLFKSYTIENVPYVAGRETEITGTWFSTNASVTFNINTEWKEKYTININE